jgi:hypothetical protein
MEKEVMKELKLFQLNRNFVILSIRGQYFKAFLLGNDYWGLLQQFER